MRRLIVLRLLLAAASLACPAADDLSKAVIAGTVFRDPGFALARAEVVLSVKTPPERTKKKVKPQKILTDSRGEFAFYVPAEKSAYVVSVKAPGLEPQEKTVELAGGAERTDTYFTLKPATKTAAKE